jgi:hypothetical protein
VAWVDTESYVSSSPDIIAKYGSEKTLKVFLNCAKRKSVPLLRKFDYFFFLMQQKTCVIWQELNNTFSERLRNAFSADAEVDDAAFISIDSQGVDIRVRQGAQASSLWGLCWLQT